VAPYRPPSYFIAVQAAGAQRVAEERQAQARENRLKKRRAVESASEALTGANQRLNRARAAARSAATPGERASARTFVEGYEGERAASRRAYDMALNRARRSRARVDPEIVAAHRTGRGETPPAGGETPPPRGGTPPAAPGVTGGGQSPTTRTPEVAQQVPRTTRSVTPRKRGWAVDAKNAKPNTVLGKALKIYGEPHTSPSATGELLPEGAKSPHHVKLGGKEFQDFKKKYLDTHKSGKNLSDWSLRAMAKMLKYKNSSKLRETYGLKEHKPEFPSGD